MKTTLNAIRAHGPCAESWEKLLRHLGKTQADDEPLRIAEIVESNGLDDALWCLRAVTGHDREIRLFAVWCARQVQHLMKDQRSLNALDVAERFANGEATAKELEAARAAAWYARGSAWVAYDSSYDSSYDAACAARYAAWAARYAAMAALDAAMAALDAAMAAAYAAFWSDACDTVMPSSDADKAAQKSELLRICAEIEAREAA